MTRLFPREVSAPTTSWQPIRDATTTFEDYVEVRFSSPPDFVNIAETVGLEGWDFYVYAGAIVIRAENEHLAIKIKLAA